MAGELLERPAGFRGPARQQILDPTGCGDAYRAGLLYGIINEMSWEDTGRLASLLGAEKIAHRGTQNHQFSKEKLASKFETAFRHEISW